MQTAIERLEAEVKRLEGIIEEHIRVIHSDPDGHVDPLMYEELFAAIEDAFDRSRDALADANEMANIIGCLEPDEDGRPACDPACIACRYTKAAEEARDGL
jgi:hypothetical protein